MIFSWYLHDFTMVFTYKLHGFYKLCKYDLNCDTWNLHDLTMVLTYKIHGFYKHENQLHDIYLKFQYYLQSMEISIFSKLHDKNIHFWMQGKPLEKNKTSYSKTLRDKTVIWNDFKCKEIVQIHYFHFKWQFYHSVFCYEILFFSSGFCREQCKGFTQNKNTKFNNKFYW